ncbi:MAG: hypothetical protein KAI43_02850 [Candidatus Aureabacteria bacterium]|nr:hypothetical protein [Candidatus Auribacterota bacterium]
MKYLKNIISLCVITLCLSFNFASAEEKQQKSWKYFSNTSKGSRYIIKQASVKRITFSESIYDGASSKVHISKMHVVDVLMKISPLHNGEKTASPDIFKVYIFDKKKKHLKTLTLYYLKQGVQFVKGFDQFRLNKTYRVYFKIDDNLRAKIKYVLVIMGTMGEEIVSLLRPNAKIEDFEFDEKEM